MSLESSPLVEKKWLKKLPYARMRFPSSNKDRLKYVFWKLYSPYHPLVRDTALKLHVVDSRRYQDQQGRQPYVLGTIAPHLTVKEFISYLVSRGYGNHFVAWKDRGELASLRHVENFTFQYHIRIFNDREVRGHYEYTPESKPLSHLKKVNMEPRREYFLNLLGDTIAPRSE